MTARIRVAALTGCLFIVACDAVPPGHDDHGATASESLEEVSPSTDWPQWRGPDRDGRRSRSLAETWPEELELVWRAEVGGGYSSPVASGGRVFVHERRGAVSEGEPGVEVLRAFSLEDGTELWNASVEAPFSQNQYATSQGAGPFSTPTVDPDAGRVYSYGVNGVLEGRDVATGELQCSFVPPEPDTSNLFTGTAASPLVLDDGGVVVPVGDDRGGRIMAWSCEDERELWSWQGDGPGYASPVLLEAHRTRQVVTLTDRSLVGVEVGTGKLLWRVDFPDEWNENIVTPTLFEGSGDRTLVLVSGVRRGAVAVRPAPVGDTWKVETVWERPRRTHYMSSPVLLPTPEGALWVGLSNKRKGQLVALDPATGEDLFQGEGRFTQSASLVVAGNDLLALTVEGELVVLRWQGEESDGRLLQVARYPVADAAVWGHLAVVENLLLVRSAEALSAWRI